MGLTKLSGFNAKTEHWIRLRICSAEFPATTPTTPDRATVPMTTRSTSLFHVISVITSAGSPLTKWIFSAVLSVPCALQELVEHQRDLHLVVLLDFFEQVFPHPTFQHLLIPNRPGVHHREATIMVLADRLRQFVDTMVEFGVVLVS